MARHDILRKLRRNEQLRRYVAENPELSLREIGEAFDISRSRVCQLLGAKKGKGNGENSNSNKG